MREKILFDKGWLFHKGDIEVKTPQVKGPIYTSAKTERMKYGPACIYFNDAVDDFRIDVEFSPYKWENVDLPHDYVISGEPKEENNPALGFFDYENAWYRKHFTLGEEDKGRRLTLYFEGVATRCKVYLNGCEMAHNLCGYTSFEIDISDYVKFGEDNVLAVYTYFNAPEGWWYQGGGIYRHVWLNKTDLVSVDLYGVYAAPIKNDGKWSLQFETTVVNENYDDKSVEIVTELIDRESNLISKTTAAVDVSFKDKATAKYVMQCDDINEWNVDSPYIYTVRTHLFVDGECVDTYDTKTGFREYYIDADKGLFINGKHVFINGVCGHGDFGLTGKAVPDNIFRYKVQLMKEMGANGYRCSHYPQAESFMDALDENGFVVMNEVRWFDSTEEGLKQMEMLIKRDRNRPSVIMWSLGNEEMHHVTEEGRRINKTMIARAKKLDKYRYTTSAVSISPDKATVYDDLDLIGINYNHWLFDVVREKYPNTPIYSSECCATSTTRGWYFDDNSKRAYAPAYDRDTNSWFTGRERLWKMLKDRPWMFGEFQWIAFEHRGEAMWPRVCSQSGAIDLFLQKKDAFYHNQSYWLSTPMVHLLPHWNWKSRIGEKIKVFAYTNCEQLELILNGKSFGITNIEKYSHGEWNVEYEPGTLTVKGYIGGKVVCTDEVRTTGKPAALKLTLDNGDICANGQDIAVVTCSAVDENGLEVPDATPFVSFDCSNELAKIVGTGSDISDHTPVGCPDRKMRAGKITVALKAGEKIGSVELFAHADGLDDARLVIDLK